MVDDSYDQVSVRIYKRDWRYLQRMQLDQEAELHRKPSLAEMIRLAVKQLEEQP